MDTSLQYKTRVRFVFIRYFYKLLNISKFMISCVWIPTVVGSQSLRLARRRGYCSYAIE